MPLARLSVPSCLSPEKVRALADAVHEGLVETCGMPPNERFQVISAYAPEMMFVDPTFPNVARTPEASIDRDSISRGTHDRSEEALFRQDCGSGRQRRILRR